VITFKATRPGAWLNEDVADTLTALAMTAPDDSYLLALIQVAQARGIRVIPQPMTIVTIDRIEQ